MYPSNIAWTNNINQTDILPPLWVKKSVKETDRWQKAVMDAFEYIGREQFIENLKFHDYYRMVEGKMSYQELKTAVPHLEKLADALDGAGIPAFLKHYDLIGGLVRDIVTKYIDMQDKFHITDTGEIGTNEFLRYKNEQIQKELEKIIDEEVKMTLAKQGLTIEGKQFSSPEEQQQYIQQLEQAKIQATPKDTLQSSKKGFKSNGMKWGEATLEKDREYFELNDLGKTELKDKLLTGRCFREYKIGYDSYRPITWSPKNTFFSKEVDARFAQDCRYVGRYHYMTPSEVISKHGSYISTDKQKDLLGGNPDWKTFIGTGEVSGTIEQALNSNFNKPMWVPFDGATDYNNLLGIQDHFGTPMGETIWFDKDGTQQKRDRFLPRYQSHVSMDHYAQHASILRSDFKHRDDLCQVTEVYFIAEEYWGLLTYETESGLIVTEEVTEDILPEFLKENGIKQDFKSSIVDVLRNGRELEKREINTIKWVLKPVCYEGVKIKSSNLQEDLYLYCKRSDHQIKGDSEFDIKVPVAGYIGEPWAHKVMPYQAAYNLVMNQIYNLLEKEIGIFFLLDVTLIPSEIDGWGDAQEAMIEMRNLAKDIGILPVQTSGESDKNQNNFNQFTTHNLTYAGQIQYRVALADKYKALAYETVGTNPQQALQPTKYETAEGVRLNQEASTSAIAEIFQEFNYYEKRALELHLSVAQYAQSNKLDNTLVYTKDDASITYLRMNDPNLPFRKLGLIPSKDSRKRKEVELFKQKIINDNTVGNDFVALAKLISSDSMQELIEIATEANQRRQEQEQQRFENEKQLLQEEATLKDQLAEKEHQRKLQITDKDNQVKLAVGEMQAKGRAATTDTSLASIESIDKASDEALKRYKIDTDIEIKKEKLKADQQNGLSNIQLRMQELQLKLEDQKIKRETNQSKERIALANKN
jgi:hypothetical protein